MHFPGFKNKEQEKPGINRKEITCYKNTQKNSTSKSEKCKFYWRGPAIQVIPTGALRDSKR
jgi:hypothetical protein